MSYLLLIKIWTHPAPLRCSGGCIKSDYVFSKTYNLKVPTLLKPLNPRSTELTPKPEGDFKAAPSGEVCLPAAGREG
jgi:hypothetical protein